jgi:hypothetical protein
MKLRAGIALLAACAAVLFAAKTAANGRFPAANQIVVDPSDPSHIVVRTTYGLLVSQDGGQAWDWICEQSVQWSGQYDPPVTITEDGTLIAGIYDHLGVGTQAGCVWDRPAPLEMKNVIDVSTQKDDPAVAVALTSNGQNGMFVTQVWRSSNNGKDWTQLGVDLPIDFVGLTIDVAPSDPSSLAVTGQIGKGGPGVLERSSDGGMTWERRDIHGTDLDHAPYLGAVDPTDPLKLYIRLSGSKGTLLVTSNGGESWQEAFVGQGVLKGFALSPDGSELLVGGETDGIHRIKTADLSKEKVSDIHAQCLVWAKDGVYACAPEAKDGFTVGKSVDSGKTFTALNHLACVRGPLMCDAATEVGKSCPAVWQATAELIDQPSCPEGTGGSSGTGGAGGAGAAGGSAGSAGSGNGGGGATMDTGGSGGNGGGETGGGGCGCITAGRSNAAAPVGGAAIMLAALAGLARGRRRNARPLAVERCSPSHPRGLP